jgi:hypothetical protein
MSEGEWRFYRRAVFGGSFHWHNSKYLGMATSVRPISKSLELTLQWTDGLSQFKNGNSSSLLSGARGIAHFGLHFGTKLNTYR